MRFRLGLLQDTAALEKQAAKEAAEAQAKKHKSEAPTAKTEAQTKADEETQARGNETVEKAKEQRKKPKIRPLSEAKAIDLGSNFVSESFLFLVGIGCVLFETWRRGKKEDNRREDVADEIRELKEYNRSIRKALVELEKEALRRNGTAPSTKRILPKEVYELGEEEERETERKGWLSWVQNLYRRDAPEAKSKTEPLEEATVADSKPSSSEYSTVTDSDTTHTSILSKIFPSSHARDPSPASGGDSTDLSPKPTLSVGHSPHKKSASDGP